MQIPSLENETRQVSVHKSFGGIRSRDSNQNIAKMCKPHQHGQDGIQNIGVDKASDLRTDQACLSLLQLVIRPPTYRELQARSILDESSAAQDDDVCYTQEILDTQQDDLINLLIRCKQLKKVSYCSRTGLSNGVWKVSALSSNR